MAQECGFGQAPCSIQLCAPDGHTEYRYSCGCGPLCNYATLERSGCEIALPWLGMLCEYVLVPLWKHLLAPPLAALGRLLKSVFNWLDERVFTPLSNLVTKILKAFGNCIFTIIGLILVGLLNALKLMRDGVLWLTRPIRPCIKRTWERSRNCVKCICYRVLLPAAMAVAAWILVVGGGGAAIAAQVLDWACGPETPHHKLAVRIARLVARLLTWAFRNSCEAIEELVTLRWLPCCDCADAGRNDRVRPNDPHSTYGVGVADWICHNFPVRFCHSCHGFLNRCCTCCQQGALPAEERERQRATWPANIPVATVAPSNHLGPQPPMAHVMDRDFTPKISRPPQDHLPSPFAPPSSDPPPSQSSGPSGHRLSHSDDYSRPPAAHLGPPPLRSASDYDSRPPAAHLGPPPLRSAGDYDSRPPAGDYLSRPPAGDYLSRPVADASPSGRPPTESHLGPLPPIGRAAQVEAPSSQHSWEMQVESFDELND